MSFSFYVSAPDPPRFSAVVDALAMPDCACVEDSPADDIWHEGSFFHFYTRGRSAREVEVNLEDGRFRVRIMTCCTRADHLLALRFVDTIARMTGGAIEPEQGAPVSVDDRQACFGDEWVATMTAHGPKAVIAMVDRDGQTLTMSGPRRPFYIGPRFLKELRARGSDMPLEDRILDAMVRLQGVDEEEYYPAAVLQVAPKGGGNSISLSAWAAGVGYLFPAVQYLALMVEGSTELLVPQPMGPRIAGEAWTWMDERHALVEATAPSDWPELCARASEHRVLDPFS